MASSNLAGELDELTDVDLETKLREAKEELFNLRFQAATGQLESHGRLRTVKKDIARIYTVVRERELGIRTTPGAARGMTRAPRGHGRGHDRGTDRDTTEARRDAARTPARSVRAWSSATRWTRPWSSPSRTVSSTPSTARCCVARRKLKAHDEQNACGVGDRVLIMETRPLSAPPSAGASSRSSRRPSNRSRPGDKARSPRLGTA